MFRKHPQELNSLLGIVMRNQGLETPLRQRRLIASWDEAVKEIMNEVEMAEFIIASTKNKEIRNQTLWVSLDSSAARQEILMHTTDLVNKLNSKVGTRIITGIRFM